jgi:hypothetical protein
MTFFVFLSYLAEKNLPGKGGEETREAIDNTAAAKLGAKLTKLF